MAEKKYGVFSSSEDPQKLALTVKGLAGLIPVIILLAKLKGVDLGADELNSLLDDIASLILILGAVLTSCMTVYGGVRKIVMRFY